MLQMLEQQNRGNIKILSCSFNALKSQSIAKREGEARQQGSRESGRGVSHQIGSGLCEAVPQGFVCNENLLAEGEGLVSWAYLCLGNSSSPSYF